MSANSLGDQWALREWNNLTFEDSGVVDRPETRLRT
jgi:hypothetical protein